MAEAGFHGAVTASTPNDRDPLFARIAAWAGPMSVEGPIGLTDPTVLLDALGDLELIYWHDPEGSESVAVGAAREVVAVGDGRFSRIEARSAELLKALSVESVDGRTPASPRAFAAFAFESGSRDALEWRAFPDAVAVVPEIRVDRTRAGSRLSVTAFDRASPGLLERVSRVRVVAGRGDRADQAFGSVVERSGTTDEEYRGAVEQILGEIAAGVAEKIVVARRLDLLLGAPVPLGALVRRLRVAYPGCYVFAFRRRDESGRWASFVGASPELLVRTREGSARSEALAGSIGGRSGDDGASQRLLDSLKDRAEHQLVVDHVESVLRPLLAEIRVDSEPTVRRLPTVVHLSSSVTGRLARPMHVVGLAAALHPTPAVGGVPAAAARAWLSSNEGIDRGWYAGPVGWFDREGDGEFAVAIRSALVDGRRVSLFAGAGIVAGSDAEAELAETAIKLRALGDIIGDR